MPRSNKTTFPMPRTPSRIWRPTQKQVQALTAIRSLAHPKPASNYADAFQVFWGLAKYGYVEMKRTAEGWMVKATPKGRDLLNAVAKDSSLVRTPAPQRVMKRAAA